MIGIYDLATGALLHIVEDMAAAEKHDLSGCGLADIGDPDWRTQRWDSATHGLVADFAALDAELHARIDAEAGVQRTRFITDIPGQEATYLEKEQEARAYQAAAAPVETDYPLLKAEADASTMTVTDLAAEVLATADNWRAVNRAIEAARMSSKRAVTAAADQASKEAAAAVDWDAVVAGAQA